MFAPRADKVIRKRVTLVHITAHNTDKSFFLIRRRSLDIFLIITVSHGLFFRKDFAIRHVRQKERMRAQISRGNYFCTDIGVCFLRQINHAVLRSLVGNRFCLVDILTALKTPVFVGVKL